MAKVENDGQTDKYGEPVKYDPTFNGPVPNRGCTDVLCCVLFLICIFGMLAVAAYGLYVGDPHRLVYPSDSDGAICGRGKYLKKPYLLFFNLAECVKMGSAVIFTGCPTPQVCVGHCPPRLWTWQIQHYKEQVNDYHIIDRKNMYCRPGVNPFDPRKSVKDLVKEHLCAPYLLPTRPVMGRCMPSKLPKIIGGMTDRHNKTVTKEQITKSSHYLSLMINAQDTGLKILQDIEASWTMCIAGFFTAMVLCLLWIILMRWIAGVLVWLSILLFVASFSTAAAFSLMKYCRMKDDPDHQVQGQLKITKDMSYYWNLAYTWLTIGILCVVVVLIIFLVLLFLRKHLCMAILIIKEASRAVGMMKFTLLWPLMPFVLQLGMVFFWGLSAVHLASSAPPSYVVSNNTMNDSQARLMMHAVAEKIPCDPKLFQTNDTRGQICSFLKYGGESYTKCLQFYQLFMLFWMMNFIEALGQVTLAGAFASYYWTFNKPGDVPFHYLGGALYRALRYHIGSIAFGSLIIAIIQIFRVILQYVEKRVKSFDNAVAKFILKCLKCCFWCLEKFVRFLSKNAYIMIAVYGKNFCVSAKNAFNLVMRNMVR
ncbi:Choline transporter-like protein 4 [Lamellibrachia satsuma]|nr:Choline transporter-like protein 4 [Lamellibrachia satsuma]